MKTEKKLKDEGDKLCKVRPLNDHLQKRCKELYQPHREISIENEWFGRKHDSLFDSIYAINQLNGVSSCGAYVIHIMGTLVLLRVLWKEWRGEIFKWLRIRCGS